MKYHKLVRDKIPGIIKKNGGTLLIHVADEKEYWQKLKEKLLEEVEEFCKDENVEEFADMLEVLDAIADYKDFKKSDVEKIKIKKAGERGKFKEKIILDEA